MVIVTQTSLAHSVNHHLASPHGCSKNASAVSLQGCQTLELHLVA